MAHSLTEATTYELLSETRRRHLLSLLQEDGTADVDTLSRQIAAREQHKRPEAVNEDVRQRVAVSLVHKHLPLLEDHNVVQYTPESKTVVLMDVIDELEQSLDQTTTNSTLRKLIPGY